jgi:hypothetical protein
MIYQVCAVRDRAVDAFMPPVFVAHIGQAMRNFGDAINGKDQTPFSSHPEDYDLYHLGSYDDSSGRFLQPDEGPRQIAIGKDLRTKSK